MGTLLKFVAGFSVAGMLISVSAGIMAGNRLTHVVVIALICTLASGALGAGVYKFLELKIPEFLEIFRGGVAEELPAYEEGADFGEAGGNLSAAEGDSGVEGLAGIASGASDGAPAADSNRDMETKHYGDHILVNKVKIKNEPKLMAQAIKTILSRDES